jgi:outer membrane protein OmpA-like peptidoglycan-associated protein
MPHRSARPTERQSLKKSTPRARTSARHAKSGSGLLALQQTAGNQAVDQLLHAADNHVAHAIDYTPPMVEAALTHDHGQPLDAATRATWESLTGEDLGEVRVHTGASAAASARAIDALAYTAKNDIVFDAGQYAPHTRAGQALLAHELGHVAEQRRAGPGEGTPVLRAPRPGATAQPNLLGAKIPAPRVTRFDNTIIATIYFGQGNFLLDALNFEAVQKLAEELRFMASPTIGVDGYASQEGTDKINQELSEKRRWAIIALLRASGSNLTGKAHGAADPAVAETAIDPIELESQRALNRRVTIVIMPTARAETKLSEKREKPIELFPRVPIIPEEESPSERLNRILKDYKEPPPRPKTSLSDEFWKVVDQAVDDVTRKVGVPKKYRGLIRDGAHAAIEKGLESALDKALGEAKLDTNQKDAIKKAVEAATKTKL